MRDSWIRPASAAIPARQPAFGSGSHPDGQIARRESPRLPSCRLVAQLKTDPRAASSHAASSTLRPVCADSCRHFYKARPESAREPVHCSLWTDAEPGVATRPDPEPGDPDLSTAPRDSLNRRRWQSGSGPSREPFARRRWPSLWKLRFGWRAIATTSAAVCPYLAPQQPAAFPER